MGVRRGALVCGAMLALVVAGAAARGPRASVARVFPRTTRAGLDSRLVQVVEAQQQHGQTAASSSATAEGLSVDRNRVQVVVEPRGGRVADAEQAVTNVGGTVTESADGLVEALVPAAGLTGLGASAAVTRVRPPALMAPESLDQGVATTNANAWQVAGNDGSGVTVAVIDVGFAGYATALAGASVTTIDHCATDGFAAGADSHGAAAAELVHQMAPGAHLLLICIDSEVGLALAEQDAIAAGAKVISHSVGWFGTSRGDGTGSAGSPDAIAADARAHGILWVNAAGNHAQGHWSGTFTPLAGFPDTNSFSGSDYTNTVTIYPGENACADLKWDDWPKTTEDFDLYLVRESDESIVADSTNDQSSGPLEPEEGLCYTNTGTTADTFGLVIQRFSATTSPRLDLFYTGASPLQYQTAAGSVAEPASSPATLAVGADCWTNGSLEPYSSQGPTIDGRVKPDLLAPDSVSTVTDGASSSCSPGSGFQGTSAATPQVAGAAALLLQRTPSLTPAGIRAELLESTEAHTGVQPNNQTGVGPLWLAPNPSGSHLAYAMHFYGDIGRAGGDGTSASTVLHAPLPGDYSHPSWSPDGTKIAAARNATSGTGIDVVPYNGGTATTIYDAGGANIHQPAWAPDNSKIAFVTGGQILVVPPGGGSATTLVTGASPAWSPDSAKIAYVANGNGTSNPEIWVMNANGSSPTQLTTGASLTGIDVDVGSPAWSPDGTKILYVNSGAIWEMDAAGTNQHVLVAGTNLWDPVWSPDGKTVAFLDGVAPDLHEVRSDGSDDTTMALHDIASPSWTSGYPDAAVAANGIGLIGGDARVGEPLEAGAALWTGGEPFTFTYAWQRCDASGLNCVPIGGAVDSTYTPVAADVGSTLKAAITATSQYTGGGSATTTTNTSGSVVIAKPYTETLPAISGTTAVGSQLTASSAVASWSGATPPLAYQWRRCDADGSSCVSIGGATSPTYTPTAADQGGTLRVAVTGTNAGGSDVISSLATAAVTAAVSGGGGGAGGGGGGGGGGSSSFTITLTPATQTVASGGSASWTVAVTNTGGAYLYAVGVKDTAAPNCGIPSSFGDTASLMPPGVTISYTCSLGSVTSSLTNSAVATATTGPGDVITQTATASVTVQGGAAPSLAPPAGVGGATAPRPTPLQPHGKTINGTAKANRLTGTNAADVINGRGGNDVIRGLGGNDTIDGGAGNDTIDGGAGNDRLTGGTGRDKVSGGAGADTIYVRDHVRDAVSCGSGKDTVYADRIDAVARDCEHVHRRGAGV